MGKEIQKPIKCYKDVSELYLGDCLEVMPTLKTDSIDAIVTDPPYGISFMQRKWDVSVPSVEIWQECLRVLKPGAFAFVMSSPRQDVLSRMIISLEEAGFNIGFSSIYWTYATGFSKAQNLSKIADKRAGVVREVIGITSAIQTRPITKKWKASNGIPKDKGPFTSNPGCLREITAPATEQAKALDGAYSGFQPKPAVEVVIVAMKPLTEKTFVNQALKNGHGCTWLDDCRIPYSSRNDISKIDRDSFKVDASNNYVSNDYEKYKGGTKYIADLKGRFPANVLCEDDVLNDGTTRKTGNSTPHPQKPSLFCSCTECTSDTIRDIGSFSRYFSLDAWFAERIKLLPKEVQKTFPWLIVPKVSKAEKNLNISINPIDNSDKYNGKYPDSKADKTNNNKHPTIKPIKLMSWLITLASREGDIILDPFCGSGTTLIAAKMLGRQYIGVELEKEYYDIARLRIDEAQQNIDKFL